MKPPSTAIDIIDVVDALPDGFAVMRAEALAEGFRHVERLAADWASAATRFDRAGEALVAASLDGMLAGIGGMTIDPVLEGALRMRRFYVRRFWRRHRVGTALAHALIARAARTRARLTVHAPPDAFAFWQSLGFVVDPRDGHSHVLRRAADGRDDAITRPG